MLTGIEEYVQDGVNVLTAELDNARWQIRLRDEMLRIITGGDNELIDAVRRQAINAEIKEGSINDVVG